MSTRWPDFRGEIKKASYVITKQPPISAGEEVCAAVKNTMSSLKTLAARGNEDINSALNNVKILLDSVTAEINKKNYQNSLDIDLSPQNEQPSIRKSY